MTATRSAAIDGGDALDGPQHCLSPDPFATYTERSNVSPRKRREAAIHATFVICNWEQPEGAPDGWLPTPQQITAKTRDMYRITPTTDDIEAALNEARGFATEPVGD